MVTAGNQSSHLVDEAWQLVDLANVALTAQTLEGAAEILLPSLTRITKSNSACLYIPDAGLSGPRFFQSGFVSAAAAEVERVCVEQFDRISGQSDLGWFTVPISASPNTETDLILYPLRTGEDCLGLLGVIAGEGQATPSLEVLKRLPSMLANVLGCLLERAAFERQLSHLNTYLTVSSTLSQSMDLHDLLGITLYCCMEAVSAEAASVLLLDDEKKNFNFYEVEGSAKSVLMSATFPADRGIAGSVLKTQEAEIINNVSQDPRFYGKVDSETGFRTRNMIVIPLVAGEEKVGVMELLNKADGEPFLDEELLLLVSIAEEMAFAIRNALVFEYVVNTYCKQRQGLMTCKGCQRPLGSWTPCVRYQEVSVWTEGLSPEDTLMLPKSRP